MNTIFSYKDILIENVLNLESNTDVVSIVLDFLKVQDELPEFIYKSDKNIELTFSNNGYNYKILCKIENGKLLITGLYRYQKDNEPIEYDLEPDQFEVILRTRNIYQKCINKILRIIKKE